MEKNIVILGGGFGGIRAAFSICQKLESLKLTDKYKVTLVDRNHYHTYTPTLYEVATAPKDLANYIKLHEIVTFHLKEVFKNLDVDILEKAVTEIDILEGDVHFSGGKKLKFDYLVIALGSEINYFDIPGLKKNSLALKTFVDAVKIRDAIWEKVESAPKSRKIKIVIGGGGATGVELAGEVKSWQPDASVKIIEAAPAILPGFDDKTVKKVLGRLKKIGVELQLGQAVAKVEAGKAILKNNEIVEFDVLVWSGGVKTPALVTTLPLKKEKRGRIEVLGEMQCLPQTEDLKLYGKVYAIGDVVCFYDPITQKPIPQVAEAAMEHAEIAAQNICEDIKFEMGMVKEPKHKKYVSRAYPYVIPVGGKYAVSKVGPIIVSGFLGWILKGLVEIYYLLFNVLPPLQAFKIWLKGLWIFVKNDRLG